MQRNKKDLFPAVAAITVSRTKLLLTFIASGKTDAAENSHFSDVGYRRTDHSEFDGRPAKDFSDEWHSFAVCTMVATRSG